MLQNIDLKNLKNRLTVILDENIEDEEYFQFLEDNDEMDISSLAEMLFLRVEHYDVHPDLLINYVNNITKSVLVKSYVNGQLDFDKLHHNILMGMANNSSQHDIELLREVRSV